MPAYRRGCMRDTPTKCLCPQVLLGCTMHKSLIERDGHFQDTTFKTRSTAWCTYVSVSEGLYERHPDQMSLSTGLAGLHDVARCALTESLGREDGITLLRLAVSVQASGGGDEDFSYHAHLAPYKIHCLSFYSYRRLESYTLRNDR